MSDQAFFILLALAFLGFVLTTGALAVATALVVRFVAKVTLVLVALAFESLSTKLEVFP
jgi:hypothetical protein